MVQLPVVGLAASVTTSYEFVAWILHRIVRRRKAGWGDPFLRHRVFGCCRIVRNQRHGRLSSSLWVWVLTKVRIRQIAAARWRRRRSRSGSRRSSVPKSYAFRCFRSVLFVRSQRGGKVLGFGWGCFIRARHFFDTFVANNGWFFVWVKLGLMRWCCVVLFKPNLRSDAVPWTVVRMTGAPCNGFLTILVTIFVLLSNEKSLEFSFQSLKCTNSQVSPLCTFIFTGKSFRWHMFWGNRRWMCVHSCGTFDVREETKRRNRNNESNSWRSRCGLVIYLPFSFHRRCQIIQMNQTHLPFAICPRNAVFV